MLDRTWGLNFGFIYHFRDATKSSTFTTKLWINLSGNNSNDPKLITYETLNIWQTQFVGRVSDYSKIRVVSFANHQTSEIRQPRQPKMIILQNEALQASHRHLISETETTLIECLNRNQNVQVFSESIEKCLTNRNDRKVNMFAARNRSSNFTENVNRILGLMVSRTRPYGWPSVGVRTW